jgi:hypothetical protein
MILSTQCPLTSPRNLPPASKGVNKCYQRQLPEELRTVGWMPRLPHATWTNEITAGHPPFFLGRC